jgi:hypothetical protein
VLLLLIFPLLVAGFLACHIHPLHSYRLHRYEGQYLYLKSAELGLLCFFIALAVVGLTHWLLPNFALDGPEAQDSVSLPVWVTARTAQLIADLTGQAIIEATKLAWFAQLTVLTSLATLIPAGLSKVGLWIRYRSFHTRVFAIGEILEDSPLDDLLYRLSLDKTKYAMVTMDDRKVYVGKVISLGEPSATKGMDQDVGMIPLMSGYRHKDKLTAEFTTFYSDIEKDIYLCLRQQSIISATEFDFDAYNGWNSTPKKPQRPKPANTGSKKAQPISKATAAPPNATNAESKP